MTDFAPYLWHCEPMSSPRIVAADNEDVLVLELQCVPEVMGVHHVAIEGFQPFKGGDVGSGKVSGGDDHMVEFFRVAVVFDEVLDGGGKIALVHVVFNPAHRGAKTNPIPDSGFYNTTLDVVQRTARGG